MLNEFKTLGKKIYSYSAVGLVTSSIIFSHWGQTPNPSHSSPFRIEIHNIGPPKDCVRAERHKINLVPFMFSVSSASLRCHSWDLSYLFPHLS